MVNLEAVEGGHLYPLGDSKRLQGKDVDTLQSENLVIVKPFFHVV